MTRQLLFVTTLVLLVAVFFNNPAYATTEHGDTLVIHQEDQDGWYPLSGTLTAATYDLHIVGGKRTAGQSRPIILTQDPFGGWFMLSGGQNVTFKGLHIMQAAETIGGNIGPWARSGLELTGVNSKVVFH